MGGDTIEPPGQKAGAEGLPTGQDYSQHAVGYIVVSTAVTVWGASFLWQEVHAL